MKRSKQTIALERLKEIGKTILKSPSPIFHQSADLATVVTGHLDFFLAVAPHTQRLKLPAQVLAVYRASCADGGVKSETMVKSEPMVKSDSPPAKKLKACLSSPTQIASLYAGSSSSVAVKVMGLCVHHKHKHTGCTNMGPSSVCHHIHTYIYI